MDNWNLFLASVGVFLTALTFFGGGVAWLNKQLSGLYNLTYSMKEDILEKLEYHERHDDKRFSMLGDSMNEIKIQTAVMNALAQGQRPVIEQRKVVTNGN